jgi:hypothetical protein
MRKQLAKPKRSGKGSKGRALPPITDRLQELSVYDGTPIPPPQESKVQVEDID